MPCRSPLVRAACPMTLRDLMQALDRAGSGDAARLLDRHVAAFIVARDQSFERSVARVARGAEGSSERKLALLSLWAGLQKYHYGAPLHGLAAAAAATLAPVIGSMKSSLRRTLLSQKLTKLADGGDVGRLIDGLDISQSVVHDKREYRDMVRHFNDLGKSILTIDEQAQARAAVAAEHGLWLATLVAFGCLAVSVVVVSVGAIV